MKVSATRPYNQTARAEAAAQTRETIMEVAVGLWRTRDWDTVTLAEIAKAAGVTPQTVLRRFGSKDGIVDACLEARASGIEAMRDTAPVGDIEAALAVLLEHYEADGEHALRTLAIEPRSAVAARIVAHGRRHHRDWCARVFQPWLPSAKAKHYATRLDAFVAASDVFVWKLLRHDLDRSLAQTRQTMLTLLDGLAATHSESNRR